MTKAFCPGHITCFFAPMTDSDINRIGSVGVGIKLNKGSTVTLEERADSRLEVTMDGNDSRCPITECTIRKLSDRGFDVTIENDLPVSQGFGMSAAGSIAAALCAASFEGKSEADAFRSANESEISNKGGLGDIAAILCSAHLPIREKPGIPPYGVVTDSGLRFDRLTLAILEGKLSTKSVLGNADVIGRIKYVGTECLKEFRISPSIGNLFSISKKFSKGTGLETEEISVLTDRLSNAGMCMLGHSVFTDLPESEVHSITDADTVECSSTDVLPFICRE